MPDLSFQIEASRAVPYAAAPLLNFALRVTNADAAEANPLLHQIHSVVLRCQIRIEPSKRHYEPGEQEQLADLFGSPSRWGQTLKPMLWTHACVVVPAFTGTTLFDLPIPCTYDFNLAAAKYFYALKNGDVPLCFLFSGTVFYPSTDGSLQVTQISWEKEASYRLPVSVWREMMEIYYPNSAFLCLRRDAFDGLAEFRRRRGLPTWEAALDELLAQADEGVPT